MRHDASHVNATDTRRVAFLANAYSEGAFAEHAGAPQEATGAAVAAGAARAHHETSASGPGLAKRGDESLRSIPS
jgi:hypothetical protein